MLSCRTLLRDEALIKCHQKLISNSINVLILNLNYSLFSPHTFILKAKAKAQHISFYHQDMILEIRFEFACMKQRRKHNRKIVIAHFTHHFYTYMSPFKIKAAKLYPSRINRSFITLEWSLMAVMSHYNHT